MVLHPQVIADMRCLLGTYIFFKSEEIDRDVLQNHLQELVQQCIFLRDNPSLFASSKEYREFFLVLTKLVKATIAIVKSSILRNRQRHTIQQKLLAQMTRTHHPRHQTRLQLKPWSQFLESDTPSLPVAHALAPYIIPPPISLQYPHIRKIKCSAVQALPQATSAILQRWTEDFRIAIGYFHMLHPHDPDFAGVSID